MQRPVEVEEPLEAVLRAGSAYNSWECLNYTRSRRELSLYGTDRGKAEDAVMTFRNPSRMTLPWFIRHGTFTLAYGAPLNEVRAVSAHNAEGEMIASITAEEVEFRSSGDCRPEANNRADYGADSQEFVALGDADKVFGRLGSCCLELHSLYSGHGHLELRGHTGAGDPVVIHLMGVSYLSLPSLEGLTSLRVAGSVEQERIQRDLGIPELFERSTRVFCFESGRSAGVILASMIGVNWESSGTK